MSKKMDISGIRYGKLTALKPTEERRCESVVWECLCDCGNIHKASVSKLNIGKVTCCPECSKEKNRYSSIKHKETKTKLHNAWSNMKARTLNPKNSNYKNYGGRGIKICEEWMEYMNFRTWAYLNGYCEGLQIDRIDNDGDYEPNNCRWVNAKVNESQWEKRKLVSTNKTGFNGVWKHKDKYYTQLNYNGKRYSSKAFNTALDAAKERIRLEIKIIGEQKTNLHVDYNEIGESMVSVPESEFKRLQADSEDLKLIKEQLNCGNLIEWLKKNYEED